MRRIALCLLLIGCSPCEDISEPYREQSDSTYTRIIEDDEDPEPVVFEVTIGEWEEPIDINL